MILYELLDEMRMAAEAGDRKNVIKINEQAFNEIFANRMPAKGTYQNGSIADMYDSARNKFINSVDEITGKTKEDREKELKEGQDLMDRIRKYDPLASIKITF